MQVSLNLLKLKEEVTIPGSEWKDISPPSNDHIAFGKFTGCDEMSHRITINNDSSWIIHVYGQNIPPQLCTLLKETPSRIDCHSASRLLEVVDSSRICRGNDDEKFIDLVGKRRGKSIVSPSGSIVAFLDSTKVRIHTKTSL